MNEEGMIRKNTIKQQATKVKTHYKFHEQTITLSDDDDISHR